MGLSSNDNRLGIAVAAIKSGNDNNAGDALLETKDHGQPISSVETSIHLEGKYERARKEEQEDCLLWAL